MTSTASSKTEGRRFGGGAVAAVFAAALASPSVWAGTASDASIAETLFRDGKELMKKGDYDQACPKLAESHRLDPAGGTVLALALCYEKAGKLASAWVRYLDADAIARREGSTDRSNAARDRAAALEPKIAKLQLAVSDDVRSLEAVELRFDGLVVATAAWDTAMPVDPGEHSVEVRAAGKKPWRTTVTIGESAERTTVDIGPLEDAPAEPPPPAATAPTAGTPPSAPPAAADTSGSDTGLVVGGVVLGVGLVAIGIGTYLGVRALDQIGEAQDRCPSPACTDSGAVELNEDGATNADIATGLVIGGSAFALAGLVTIIVAALAEPDSMDGERADTAAVTIGPWVHPNAAGIAAGGAW